MQNGATTTIASSLQVEGINNIEFTEEEESSGSGGDFKADGSVPMSGDLNLDGHTISNVGAPAQSDDAVNKGYVDDAIAQALPAVYSVGATAPADTRLLWIDTNSTAGGLKYYNGSAWAHVPVAYT